jgi:hypothetical protein
LLVSLLMSGFLWRFKALWLAFLRTDMVFISFI